MQGEWGSCLFSCNSYHPFSSHFPFPARRSDLADSISKRELCEVSPLLSVLLREMCRWIFAYMHVLHWCTTHSNCGQKILPFFKNILGQLTLIGTLFPLFFCPISPSLFWNFSKKSVIQELRTRKNGLIKRFSRVGPIITHSRESSNSQRDPQDHAYP